MTVPPQPPPPLPAWRRALRWAWLLAVGVALAVVLRRHGPQMLREARAIPPWALAGATAAMLAGVGASAMVWRVLLTGLGHPLRLRDGARVFFLGQIGKYVPGSVWPVLAQMELGRDHAVPATVSAAAFALFMAVHLLSAVVAGVVALSVTGLAAWPWLVAAVPAALLLLPGPLRLGLGLAGRFARRPMPVPPPAGVLLAACGWAGAMWGCYGLHLWLLAPGAGVPLGLVEAVGVYALAWAAGFVVVVAPAGAGAREAVMLALLAGSAGTSALLALALVSRGLGTVADALWALAATARAGRPRAG